MSGLVGMRDVSALCFVATGLLNAYAVLRHGLFTVVPIARAQVLEGLSHAVVVLDEQERLADVNAAEEAAFGNAEAAYANVPAEAETGDANEITD